MVRPTFYGLEIGKSALTMSQLGLDVTGHNIANVDTKGYTRQRIISTAYDPLTTIGRALPVTQARIGGGVKALIHDQIRSAYLDSRYRAQNTLNSYWQKRTEGLTYLESFFDNINEDTSINNSISRFFEAVKVAADDPVEGAQRKLLQTAGLDLVQQLNTIYGGLVDLQAAQNQAVKVTVDEINRIASEIADLNKDIYGFEVSGYMALDLRDKRNLLLDDLSSIIPVEYREYPDGTGQSMLEVKIGNQVLVDHVKQYELDVRETDNPIEGEANVWEVIWKARDIPDPGGDYSIYLYKGNDTNHPVTTLNIDATNQTQVANAVSTLNDLAKQFGKLHVLYDPVNGIAEPDAPDSADTAMYPLGVNDPQYKKDLAEYTSAKADYDKAVSIINQMSSFFDDPSNLPLSVDCEEGGHHAVLTLNGLVFARSAGCIDSNLISYRLNYDPPMKSGEIEPLQITGGELQAYIELRDSLDVHAPGIPYYIEMLNNLARSFVQEINAQHRAGYTEDIVRPASLGLPDGSIKDVDFFGAKNADGTYIDFTDFFLDPGDPSYDDSIIMQVTAKNFCLSEAVMNSEYNIACSSSIIVKSGLPEELQRGNNENLNALYKLFEKNDIAIVNGIDIGSFDGYATSIRFDLGNTLNFAKKTSDNYSVLTLAADNQRTAVSGVSLDEEMTELIKYQHAYNGAARVITAMDDALDKLINGTGRVGL